MIHQVTWHAPEGQHTVAVKRFKGAITSDGLPDCEMAACMHIGAHPHLSNAIGRITGHPDNTQALVMPLIAPEFGNLASPPSLESCTRDVYDAGKRLSWSATLRIAQGITDAMMHLHARGVLHGDVYAHNILHTLEGDALLSDFGAAAFFDVNDTLLAQALEKIEIRALGCLFEELAAQCHIARSSHEEHGAQLTRLRQLDALACQCMDDAPHLRPNLQQVRATLAALSA